MSVGIMDADATSITNVTFNLEAMKLSTYYKRKNEIVVPCFTFAPERHTKFVYCKDYSEGYVPTALPLYDNVDSYGLLFSGGVYAAMPLEMEIQKADTSIYEKMGEFFRSDNNFSVTEENVHYTTLMAAEHARLSLDGCTIWKDFSRQLDLTNKKSHTIVFHDPNLEEIPGAACAIRDIIGDRIAVKVGTKFPVAVTSIADIKNWCELPLSAVLFEMRYLGLMTPQEVIEWTKLIEFEPAAKRIIFDISQINYNEQKFANIILPICYSLALICRSHRIVFRLIYSESWLNPQWKDVVWLIGAHNRNCVVTNSEINNSVTEYSVLNYAQYIFRGKNFTLVDIQHKIRETLEFTCLRAPLLYSLFTNPTDKLFDEVKRIWTNLK